MKKLFSLLALVYGCHVALAQSPGTPNGSQPGNAIPGLNAPKGNGRITGMVLDSASRQPVPFATVALTDPTNGKPVDGTVCDEQGKFTLNRLPAGRYTLSITFIGYQTVEKRSVVVADRGTNLNLGTLLIASQAKQLDAVTITGQKALIEERVDRTVYNAENDQTTRGGDATDVLRRVPMLSVDLDGNVSMRGNQNIRVLINNRPSTIAANSVADALRQIPADLIKTVEVITSPSAKYDAEGSAGIINIITKKNTLQGLTLNIDSGVGLRGSNLGLNGGYRKGKMGFSLGGFGRASYNTTGSFESIQQTNSGDTLFVLNTQRADARGNNLRGRYTLGWDYDINAHNALSASVQYGLRNGNDFQDRLRTQSFQNGLLTGNSVRDVDVSDLSGTVDVNLNYTHTFEKPQQELSFLALYSRNNRTNDFLNNILQDGDYSVLSRLKNLNESNNQESTIQADYQTPIGKTQLFEIGGKNIARRVTSDYEYLFAEGSNGPFVPDPTRQLSNVFNYDQNVTAGYSSYTLGFLKTYSLKAGARYEYTTINARFQDNQAVTIPSYGVLVPSVNVSKRLKNGNSVKAAYNRRIQRPSLQFLNPNLQASNPLNATIGNPNLRPEFTNNYELSFNTNLKGTFLTFSTFLRNTNNAIQPVRNVLGRDTILTTYQNIGREDAYGLSVFANVNLSNKLSLNGGGDVYYADLNNNVSDPLYNASNQGWVYSGR
ncbi:MAG: TonB-dependent receptor, partial [Ferruginibacter sp.]|nr:TonB-dependent receptor [Cytophagales bacterium]